MATQPRYFEDKAYYHVYNRGNHKEQIFLQDRDYERFLEKIIEYKEKYPVKILAYCLMPNHFHFLLQQLAPNAISRFLSNLCNSHSRYFNVKYETMGSLFQGRFKAKKVDRDEYLVHLSRYIHLNPINLFNFLIKGTFEQLKLYRWSSLPLYLAGLGNAVADPSVVLEYFSSQRSTEDYQDFIVSNMEIKLDPLISQLVLE